MTDRKDYSGQTVTVQPVVPLYGYDNTDPVEYRVEGYWDEITGRSWMFAGSNVGAIGYAVRVGVGGLPIDDNVLYGKVGSLGYLVHVSEVIDGPESASGTERDSAANGSSTAAKTT
jgi:hypothetical protein